MTYRKAKLRIFGLIGKKRFCALAALSAADSGFRKKIEMGLVKIFYLHLKCLKLRHKSPKNDKK
ncbi:hypothetical protein AZI86_01000 [Bdellovibrio bacteriovorus]|uniref:Uncharacterized protein n=1 Tax=Bdellovibrio bacteriovorus TaxID=959 RepID=A0A150WMT4_BDEBC|nr:hypothetical protein AZI86_01000 [Bdellovibrio bacteriovorus]